MLQIKRQYDRAVKAEERMHPSLSAPSIHSRNRVFSLFEVPRKSRSAIRSTVDRSPRDWVVCLRGSNPWPGRRGRGVGSSRIPPGDSAPMIVISDTSQITALLTAGEADLTQSAPTLMDRLAKDAGIYLSDEPKETARAVIPEGRRWPFFKTSGSSGICPEFNLFSSQSFAQKKMKDTLIAWRNNWKIGSAVIAAMLAVGCIDYLTGPRFGVLMFYLAPVCFSAWHAGRLAGLMMAAASAFVWFLAQTLDPAQQYPRGLIVWNAFAAFGVMAVSALLAAKVAERTRVENALRITQQELEARVRERTAELAEANTVLKAEIAERTEAQTKLRLLNETLEQRVAERSAAAEHRSRELAISEAALRRQTGLLQSILNSIGDGVVVVDANSQIVLFNPAAERLFDLQSEPNLFNSSETAEFKVGGEPEWVRLVRRATRGEPVDSAEVLVRSKNGKSVAWLSATGRPFADEPGKQPGAVVVFRDITSHKLLEKQIIEISDREQCRMGQELHDGLCQHLVGTGFATELLRQTLAQNNIPEATRAEKIYDMVNQAITQARQLARGLYPVRLEIDGLPSALDELAQRTRNLHPVDCEFTCEGAVSIHDSAASFNLYRIAQEAVNNAVKHGRCSRISLCLEAVEDEITLTIKDNGVGIPPAPNPQGMGLHIMNYRAQVIGASLNIRRGLAGGAVVTCSYRNENRKDTASTYDSREAET